jgi:hypothetical protein
VKTLLSCAIVFVVLSVCAVPATAESRPQGNRVIQYSAVRTASNPGYYCSDAVPSPAPNRPDNRTNSNAPAEYEARYSDQASVA